MLYQMEVHRKQGITRHQVHKDIENAQYEVLLSLFRCLDVVMGKGRNAPFLASHGFEVVGLENSRHQGAAVLL